MTYIVGANFTSLGSVSYSQIVFTTPAESNYVDMDLDVFVYVGSSQAECLLPSCSFNWARSVTPHFDTVSPQRIRGRTNLTINGRNLLSGNNTEVKINGNLCNITQLRNASLQCTVMGVEAGTHQIEGSIEGLFSNSDQSIETISFFCRSRKCSIVGECHFRCFCVHSDPADQWCPRWGDLNGGRKWIFD